MLLESCLPQLFFGLSSYDSAFNLPEVHDRFFFSSFEHDIHILKDINFPLFVFTASNGLNLLFSPKQQIDFFSPFKVF